MRGLKILVVIMGVLILAGFTALFIAIAGRLSQPRSAATAVNISAASSLELPTGARIESIGVGTDRLALSVLLANNDRQIIIIELATGRRVGTIPLRTTP